MNGTRLQITGLMPRVLQARLLTGEHASEHVLIPRIDLKPSIEDLPFEFSRRQFPVKLAFSMTVNKSKGQTLSRCGLWLPISLFSFWFLPASVL